MSPLDEKINVSVDTGVANILEYLKIKEGDTILYLGGRVDDDNLYPAGYRKYLRQKIEKLNPTKIICHSHWYASKYYNKGLLSKNTKIDMIVVNNGLFQRGECQPINREDYDSEHRSYISLLVDKNPRMIFAGYTPKITAPSSTKVDPAWFGMNYDLKNIKCFSFSRAYKANSLINWSLNPLPNKKFCDEWGHVSINSTDGFAIINGILSSGFKNLNIIGFSAFGMNEDTTYFTPYSLEDSRFNNLKYFDIKTTENQMVEAEILKNYVDQKRITNLEDYGELWHHLKEKNDKRARKKEV